MATLKDIRKRILSVTNTQTITKAMQMVSAAKFRRAEENVLKARPYAEKLTEMVHEMSKGVSVDDHPFLKKSTGRKQCGIIVVSGDKGLCGSFNNNIIFPAEKEAEKLKKEGANVGLFLVGKKGYDYFKKTDLEILAHFTEADGKTSFEIASNIANQINDAFISEKLNELLIYFTSFKSVVKHEVIRDVLLPISTSDQSVSGGSGLTYLFEPGQKEILNNLYPKFIENKLNQAILESQTSEHGARMTAMDTASNNCRDLISDLTLIYNKARQSSITNELLDIVAGAEALKK